MPIVNKTIIWAVAVFGWVLACAPVRAQSSINSVRIYTEPAGLYFEVDGQNFLNSVDLPWPATSKHIVVGHDQVQVGTQYTISAVFTNLSALDVNGKSITADPALQWVKLVFVQAYALTLGLPDCPADAQTCPAGVLIELNGTLYDRRTVLYLPAGSAVHARAFPASGYIFTGWSAVWQLGITTQYDITFPMLAPLMLTAFGQAAPNVLGNVNIVTDPPQLQVLLDRTNYLAPQTLQWGLGTVHSIGTEAVQLLLGAYYVFDSWSDGGDLNHDVQVPSNMTSMTFTAKFVPAVAVGFGTTPSGLSLNIDGSQVPNFLTYDFYWAVGTVHKISAPATQTDIQGRKYRFVSWSNGQPASWTFTAGTTPAADRILALYEQTATAVFNAVPPGMSLQVDGVNCDTPCTIEKAAGTSVRVSAPSVRKIDDRSRLGFQGWTDSAEANRVIVLSPGSKTYTANYILQNLLSVAAAPPEGASFVLNPPSADGFYNAGSLVSIAANLAPGFRITGWSGDLSGTSTAVALTLDAPKSAVLLLDRVPAIAPLGVRNAALGASAESVAPGSLISIFGANLAPALEIGPPNPLAQTLQGVTVRADDTFLPLVFVSPGQINAQLPATLAAGTHQIIVRWEGKPETAAQVLVVRNAPGLFGGNPPDQPVGAFVRASGQAVTPDEPAHAGEIVSVLGTGLGPYVLQPPDGFLFDETSGYVLKDTVTVVLNDVTLDALYAGRSIAGVGVDAVRFQVPATLPDSPSLTLKIRVNGQESNTVLLPVAR